MSWGADPTKWGKQVTVRFKPKELEELRTALRHWAGPARRWGGWGRTWTLSDFIREKSLAAARRTAPAASDGPAAHLVTSDAAAAGRKTRKKRPKRG